MDAVTITIVVDNHAEKALEAEHGLSMWVEADGQTLLFDSGQGAAFEKNLPAMGLDLKEVDTFVLSHGHYDHTGGIPHVIEKAPGVDLYGHPAMVRPRYALNGNGSAKPIQMPRRSMAAIDGLSPARLHWVQRPVMLSKNVGLTGAIPRGTDFEDTGGPFFLDPAGSRPDPIDDDMALFIRTNRGLVVCLGCCHSGIVNTIRYLQKITGEEKIRAIIGGLHLVNADERRIRMTIDALDGYSPEVVAPCHCTGDKAVAEIAGALNGCAVPGMAGKRYEFK